MKNFISYYYNLVIDNIYFNNEKYFFYSNQIKYMLQICSNPNFMSYYDELKNQLGQYQYFFELISNRENNYITWIENRPYVLLKLSNIINSKISIFDIKTDNYLFSNNKLFNLNRFRWVELWENKIDYFEEWFSYKQESYKKLFPLFHFFIGIAENALLYLKETERYEEKAESDNLVASHNRLTIDYELYDYYDPTNIILDHSSRDVSEYIKSAFLNKVWDIDLVKSYLDNHNFSKYGVMIMYSRILFPSFFFDYIEEMITTNRDIDLFYLENRANEFQTFIKEISLFLNEQYGITLISWLTKKI